VPRMALQPPLPEIAPSAAISRTICTRSMTPPPRLSSASQRPIGPAAAVASGFVAALHDDVVLVRRVARHYRLSNRDGRMQRAR
jgi:hypothetical protein